MIDTSLHATFYKAAIIHLTRVMALETAEQNIRVTVICPGDIDTPIQESGYAGLELGRDDWLAAIASTIPMKRIGRSEEIAPTVMFMASDAASFATGSVYSVDGGAVCRELIRFRRVAECLHELTQRRRDAGSGGKFYQATISRVGRRGILDITME